MEQNQSSIAKWLATATEGIRFKPDREAVRAELAAHLEDKAAGFRRVFSDMTEEEARARALSEMGDAREIGKELAKVHKPWLGWLWMASKWTARLMLAGFLLFSVVSSDHYASAGHPLWGEWADSHGPDQSQMAQLGGYTFRVTGAAYLDYSKNYRSYQDGFYVTLRVSSPRFWERFDPEALYGHLTVVGPDGKRWPVERWVVSPDEQPTAEEFPTIHVARWSLFYREISINLDASGWQEGDRMTLEFDFGQGAFSLTADQIELVVIE